MDDLISQGANAIKSGDYNKARNLLTEAVKSFPDNESAWKMMFNVCKNDRERIICLNNIIRINPKNEKARTILSELINTDLDFNQIAHNKDQTTGLLDAAPPEKVPQKPQGQSAPKIKNTFLETGIPYLAIIVLIIALASTYWIIRNMGIFPSINSITATQISRPVPSNKITMTPQPARQVTNSIPTKTPTVTPSGPVSYVYEGVCTYCTCENCICVTNLMFTARITINPDGNVTGALDKYIDHSPSIKLKGTTSNITGMVRDLTDNAEITEFVGSLSKDRKTFTATLLFTGPGGTGRRELYLTRK